MQQPEDSRPEEGAADAISWLLLACMAVAVIAGLFILLRIP